MQKNRLAPVFLCLTKILNRDMPCNKLLHGSLIIIQHCETLLALKQIRHMRW